MIESGEVNGYHYIKVVAGSKALLVLDLQALLGPEILKHCSSGPATTHGSICYIRASDSCDLVVARVNRAGEEFVELIGAEAKAESQGLDMQRLVEECVKAADGLSSYLKGPAPSNPQGPAGGP